MTVCRDALKLDSPQATAELALLNGMTVGDAREGVLLPALEVGVQWVLTLKTADRWEFDGEFFGQPMYRLVIRIDGALLTLNVLEGV